MKIKNLVGKLITIRFTDRKDPIRGFVIEHNDEWILMKHNVVDYVIDGCIIVRNKNIKSIRREKEEKFIENILFLKGMKLTYMDVIPLTGIVSIMSYLTEYFKVVEIETKSENACYLGRLKSLESKVLVIDYLNTRGRWDGEMKLRPGDIRVIQYNTDYINSLKLVLKQEEMKKFAKENVTAAKAPEPKKKKEATGRRKAG